MRLYLVRHGLANNREKDPERRLSNQGKKEVREISSSAAS
ncbi:MAG: phosphohistidine phosphatase SixA, partial [bacterium]|nr:phosphohistidine phosphatase SixA [bacterium]